LRCRLWGLVKLTNHCQWISMGNPVFEPLTSINMAAPEIFPQPLPHPYNCPTGCSKPIVGNCILQGRWKLKKEGEVGGGGGGPIIRNESIGPPSRTNR